MMFRPYQLIARSLSGTPAERSSTLRRVHRQVMGRVAPKSIRHQGHTVFLDPTDAMRLSIVGDNPEALKFLLRVVRVGDVVVDVGAHIGYYTICLARAVGSDGHVFAFEPDPDNVRLLRKNVRANGYQNVTIIPKAVSDRCGQATLYLSDCSAMHRTHPSPLCSGCVYVETTDLDTYFAGFGHPIKVIKLDVEGGEPLVLRGMARLLQDHKDLCLLTEFLPDWLREAGFTRRDLIDPLVQHGFTPHAIDQVGLHPTKVCPEELLAGEIARLPVGPDIWWARCRPRTSPEMGTATSHALGRPSDAPDQGRPIRALERA